MVILGKLLGGLFGALLLGPIGCFLGVFIGHIFDQGLKLNLNPLSMGRALAQSKQAFFNATFLIMGHIAKSDGLVSHREIEAATEVMRRLQLTPLQRKQAIALFEQGKQKTFDLNQAIHEFARHCHHVYLRRLFLEIQISTALAEGPLKSAQKHILYVCCDGLSVRRRFVDLIEAQLGQFHRQSAHPAGASEMSLEEAYALLGIDHEVTSLQLKRAYRKQMSEHHPDKLMAKGLPQSMVKMATEKTQQIQKAYQRILKSRQGVEA